MKLLDIGEVARRAGLPPATLRYYEEIGLIEAIGRHGLRRQYGPDVLVRLSLIALGKQAGFSLPEIGAMIGRDDAPDLPRAEFRARAAAVDAQARTLQALAETLRHVADCPAPSHLECPTFLRLLRVAVARGRRSGRRS